MELDRSHRGRGGRSGVSELVPWSHPLAAFAAVAILLFAYLCQYAQVVGCQYALVDLRAEQRQLTQEKAELELAIQELTSLELIESAATQRLGMVLPESRELLDLTLARSTGRQVATTGPVRSR